MKSLISTIALALIVCGCSTTSSVEQKQGKGTKQVYRAPFDQVWRASVDAAQIGDLEVLNANREKGYISARRYVRPETFGEVVGVWITRLSPTETTVEVVSRQAGPPVLYLKNWEAEIHRAIAANLTREAVGAGGTAATSGQISGTSSREEMRRDAQRRVDELRRQEQQKEDLMATEEDALRRADLQAEIERLRSERRTLEDYLLDLEVERP